MKKIAFSTLAAMTALLGGSAFATTGRPVPDGINFVPPATALAEEVHAFHHWIILPVMVLISLFVLALLIIIVVKYNHKANKEASQFSHNTLLEILWTGIPILILIFISLFSFELLFKEDVMPDGKIAKFQADGTTNTYSFDNDFEKSRRVKKYDHLDVFLIDQSGIETQLAAKSDYTAREFGADEVIVELATAPAAGQEVKLVGGRTRVGPRKIMGMFGEDRSEIATRPTLTIKATGYQWGWNYNYPEQGDFDFDAVLMPKEELEDKTLYLLEPTNRMLVPEGETVRMIITARDVIHAWTIPAFSVKVDAVPGRMNQIWFRAPSSPGVYYGQCSEICGKDHAYMPIAVEVVSKEEFEAWAAAQ